MFVKQGILVARKNIVHKQDFIHIQGNSCRLLAESNIKKAKCEKQYVFRSFFYFVSIYRVHQGQFHYPLSTRYFSEYP